MTDSAGPGSRAFWAAKVSKKMSRLDDLPPDQRAALSLLLRQRKAYAEVAAMLQISERAVHDRAHAALAVLAPRQARELAPERREQIGDYLLGQSAGGSQRLHARRLLEDSPAAQAWARAVAEQLASLAPGSLPEIPDGAGPAAATAPATLAGEHPPAEPARAESATTPSAPPAGAASRAASASLSAARSAAQLPSSRLGGAIVLAAIAAVVVAVVLLTSGGGSHSRARSPAASAGASTSTSSTSTASSAPRATETKRLTLTPPNASSKALGVAAVLREGSTYAFYLLRGLVVQLRHQLRAAQQEPARGIRRAPAGRRATAGQRRLLPADDRDQGDERTPDQPWAGRVARQLRPALISRAAFPGS